MKCPFLKEATVRYCEISPYRKMVPQASIHEVDQRCSSPAYVDCPMAKGKLRGRENLDRCPFLRESIVQCCEAAPVVKLLPCNDSLFSRCNGDAHRHCPLYLQRANPRRSRKTETEGERREGDSGDAPPLPSGEEIPVPDGLFFARNHLWLDVGEDGSCDIGVDAFLARTFGEVERISFATGSGIRRPLAVLTVRGVDFPLVFPNPIQVTGSNALLRTSPETLVDDPYGAGWLFEGKRPNSDRGEPPEDCRHNLVCGGEAAVWMQHEADRMSRFVHEMHSRRSSNGGGWMMDGGTFSENLVRHLSREEMLQLYNHFFAQYGG